MSESISSTRRGSWMDLIFRNGTRFAAILVLLAVIGIFVSLAIGSHEALKKFGLDFFTSTAWNPVAEEFGGLSAIFGTLVTSLIAIVIAVPVSFGIALFITELAPVWLKRPVGTAIELLAAIPSIIYGMWGLFVFAPLFGQYVQPWVSDHIGQWPVVGVLFSGPPLGIGIFTAGLILAIMILPFITSVMRDVFDLVPAVLKESAYGLGCTTWEVVWNVVLRYAKTGVVGGIMLGLGRALGETMAVTFVIGNAHQVSASLFMPGNTISSTLANEFSEATTDLYTSALMELGLILSIITFFVLIIAKLLLLRLRAREGSAT